MGAYCSCLFTPCHLFGVYKTHSGNQFLKKKEAHHQLFNIFFFHLFVHLFVYSSITDHPPVSVRGKRSKKNQRALEMKRVFEIMKLIFHPPFQARREIGLGFLNQEPSLNCLQAAVTGKGISEVNQRVRWAAKNKLSVQRG